MLLARRRLSVLVLALALSACRGEEKGSSETQSEPDPETETAAATGTEDEASDIKDIESADILARTEVADEVDVKHVLIGWKDLAGAYGGRMDPRAKERTEAEATELAAELAEELGAEPEAIDRLMKGHSEDPGSRSGKAYTVTADSQFVPEFKKLALRLKVDEVGVVRTKYGYHVMVRVAPPPPDPLESADILAREPVTDKAEVKHILLGWEETNTGDPRAEKRTRAELEELVKKTVASLREGEAIEPLMAELSEDPGSAESGKSYAATPGARLVPPFKALSLRLKKDEVGVVKTPFGMHIIQRVE